MYLQCKLALQVQSKHKKILKKQKQKQNSNQRAYLKEKRKKKTKQKVHLTNWLNQKKNYSWAFGSFYIVNRYDSLHKYLKGKKKKNFSIVEINVKMLWTNHFFYLIYKKSRSQQLWKYCDKNKCCNIFSKHLFLVVVGHWLIFYYFISTCKKLIRQ